jgi:hypothetical protein
MFGVRKMKYHCSVVVLVLLLSGFPVRAQGAEPGIPKAGVIVGAVVDPYFFGIEQVHAAAAVLLAYQKRLAVSLRPMVLFNSRSVYFRVSVLLEIPLFQRRCQVSQNEPSLRISAVGGAGVGSWDGGTESGLRPLISAGVELSVCSIVASGFITAVVRENDLDLLADLFLGYLWDLDRRIHP